MKILLFFLLMFTNIFSYSQWLKVFEDNFDGEQLNKSKWHDRRPLGDWPPDVEPDITLPKNVELSNGYLYLYLINENNYYHQTYYDNNSPIYFYPFSKGMIWSKPKFKYGIYEAKILLPKDKINWTAFWLYNGQEIDIIEQFNIPNNDNKVNLQSTIHSDGKQNVKNNKKNRSFLDNWHVYTLLWDNYNDNNANIDIQFDGNREARFRKRNKDYIGYGNNKVIQNVTINNSKENINVYPNPTKDIVFIELLNEIDSYKYGIYDSYGKLILSNSLNYGLSKLNISYLLNGFSFIKIYSENNSFVKKLIVL